MSQSVRSVFVISDLHIGGVYANTSAGRGFRINTHVKELAEFIRWIAQAPPGDSMAPFRQSRSREPTSASSRRLREAQPDDAQIGGWPRQQLEQMNARFAERMTRAAFTDASEMADPRPPSRRNS